MRYIDKVIKKLFIFSINKIKDDSNNCESLLGYYEESKDVNLIYIKSIKDEKFILINGGSSGVGLYILEETLFYIFESLCNSEYYDELTSIYSMKKNLKQDFYNDMSLKIMISTLEICNSKNFYLKENIRASNCIEF